MSHMVIFQTQDGSPGYNQFESIDGAVAFVEKLRNDQGIENARIFALEEVKFELKPYFRVELQALNPGGPKPGGPAPAPAAPSAPAQPPGPSAHSPAEPTTFGAGSPAGPPPGGVPSQPAPPAAAPEAPESSQPTRRGLFGR